MPFPKRKLENGRERYMCRCGSDRFLVEYGPLKRPKKGKNEKGIFGRCAECGEEHHIRYGSGS